jgi:NNP family nitrate/nitrite transporter-like MFS transporter
MQRTANPRPSQILAVSILAFAACFAVWTIFSIIGIGIKERLSGN